MCQLNKEPQDKVTEGNLGTVFPGICTTLLPYIPKLLWLGLNQRNTVCFALMDGHCHLMNPRDLRLHTASA